MYYGFAGATSRIRTQSEGAAAWSGWVPLTPPRMRPEQLADRRFHLRADLRRVRTRAMRTIREPVQAFIPVPANPAMYRLTRHPEPLGNLAYDIFAESLPGST
jgi:hypothetical protein